MHWSFPAGGLCPSVANVSVVQSGQNYSVTVEAKKPNCKGWRNVASYSFSIVCDTNCTTEFRDSGNSTVPIWVFRDVGTGVFTVTIIAENSCGEQTVLAQEQIPVGEPYTGKHVCKT